MKNKAQTQDAADTLPDFLNEVTEATEGLEELLGSDPEAALGEHEAADHDGEHAFAEDEHYDDGDDYEPEQDAQATPFRAERAGSRADSGSSGGGSALAMLAGVVCMLGGVGLGASGAAVGLAAYGLQPGTLLTIGAVMLGVGLMRRHVASIEHRIGSGSAADTAALRADVQQLVEAQRAHEERAPAAGEELQHVLLLLQRQDEKVNNLTKAIKMYGKPLMEIAGQTTELAGALGQLRTTIEGNGTETRAAIAQVQAAVPDNTALTEGVKQVLSSVQKTTAAIDQLAKNPGKEVSIEPLQQQSGRIEVAVQALAQRLEDTEVRRSLVRLEDAAKRAHEEMQQLLRGEKVNAVATQLQKALDTAASRLLEGIGQLREGNLGGLESSVKEIHREVAGVATVVHQIQSAVRNGARVAAPAAAAPAAPSAPAATAPTQTAAPAATPAPAGAPRPLAAAPPPATRPARAAARARTCSVRSPSSSR
ncbi:MAG: hypothetical protein H6838_08760 [Planctomycetes bacterium]|nr:hypothetical protein [Planctomycetota bacterium]